MGVDEHVQRAESQHKDIAEHMRPRRWSGTDGALPMKSMAPKIAARKPDMTPAASSQMRNWSTSRQPSASRTISVKKRADETGDRDGDEHRVDGVAGNSGERIGDP